MIWYGFWCFAGVMMINGYITRAYGLGNKNTCSGADSLSDIRS